MIEWYDFYIFGSLAVTISPLFYPEGNDTLALIAYLSTFAVGFVVVLLVTWPNPPWRAIDRPIPSWWPLPPDARSTGANAGLRFNPSSSPK